MNWAILFLACCQDPTDSRRIDFSFLGKFRQHLVEDHFKELPQDLRSAVGNWVTITGFVFLRSADEGQEVLLLQAPYDPPRTPSSTPPGQFTSIRVKFRNEPATMKNAKPITVTGIFRLEHQKKVGMFNIEDAVEGDAVTPNKVNPYSLDPSGITKLSYAVLDQTRKANVNQSTNITIPDLVKSYDGKWISLTGFVLSQGAIDQIDEIRLSKYPFDICCLGLQPTIFEMVKVRFKPGTKLSNRLARILTVSGRFTIKLERPEGYIRSLYTIEEASEGLCPEPVSTKEHTGTISFWFLIIPAAAVAIAAGVFFLKRCRAVVAILVPFALVQSQPDDKITMGDVILANNPKDPFMQGQALDKIRTAGAKAVPAIIEFVKKYGHNGLSLQGTEVLEAIQDSAVVNLLAELVQNKKFFWRPAAMWSLATQANKSHLEIFRTCLKDNLWGVRQSAIRGLEKLNDKESLAEIKKLLSDEIYAVRAQAAKTIYSMGDETGLPVLISALRDETMWFDIDYGAVAREDAWNFLKKLTKDDFGFKPWKEKKSREKGLVEWEKWIANKFPNWKDMVPETARFKPDDSKYVFGFELRSCQLGDYFFRIDSTGKLSLGCFNVVKAKMTDEEVTNFNELAKSLYKIDPDGQYGRPGCDIEKYYLTSQEGGLETRLFFVTGRPATFDKFIVNCTELIRKHFGEGNASEFKELTNLFREQQGSSGN